MVQFLCSGKYLFSSSILHSFLRFGFFLITELLEIVRSLQNTTGILVNRRRGDKKKLG